MKKTLLLVILLLTSCNETNQKNDAVINNKIKDSQNKTTQESIDYFNMEYKSPQKESIKITSDDVVLIKLDNEILKINFSNLKKVRDKTLLESADYNFTLITKNNEISGFEHTSILYNIKKKEKGFQLKRIKGNQIIHKGNIKFEWSYASTKSLYIYLTKDQKYTILN